MIDKDFEREVTKDIARVQVESELTGASLQCHMLGVDTGAEYQVTGDGISSRYRSAGGAYASYRARWKSHSIWRVTDGKRKLVFR